MQHGSAAPAHQPHELVVTPTLAAPSMSKRVPEHLRMRVPRCQPHVHAPCRYRRRLRGAESPCARARALGDRRGMAGSASQVAVQCSSGLATEWSGRADAGPYPSRLRRRRGSRCRSRINRKLQRDASLSRAASGASTITRRCSKPRPSQTLRKFRSCSSERTGTGTWGPAPNACTPSGCARSAWPRPEEGGEAGHAAGVDAIVRGHDSRPGARARSSH